MRHRRTPHLSTGFSMTELLLTIGIMAIIAGVTIPNYRNYHIRNDLDLAATQTEQMLRRAQFLSQSGEEDSVWGVHAGSGILFKGTDFGSRDLLYDEHYPLSPTITVSGLIEITFSRLYGTPDTAGTIVLTALNGEERRIPVDAGLGGEQTIVIPSEDVGLRIVFDRIKNSGNGNAENKSYIGENAEEYADGEWIPLTSNGQVQTDTSLVVGVSGLAVERKNGYVRILAYGDLESGGKEVVDVTIIFENATVENIENDTGTFETENPFDGVVNEGVGGDEVTIQGSNQVFFQTRTTNYGDGIFIYWKQAPSRWL